MIFVTEETNKFTHHLWGSSVCVCVYTGLGNNKIMFYVFPNLKDD